jgi:hypothetical protein
VLAACFFCDAPTGRNDDIESCPAGQRLAFDAARGRFWVVCPSSGRWNLAPLDGRWEAIEDCERRFRDSTVRVCSEEIGLAQLRSGLELIRIGRPVRPEFAAWRYGSTFVRRHRNAAPRRFIRAMAIPAVVCAGPLLAATLGPMGGIAYLGAAAFSAHRLLRRPALTIPLQGGGALELAAEQIRGAELIRAENEREQWAVWVGCLTEHAPAGCVIEPTAGGESRALLTGADGRAAATLILPSLNPLGGDPTTVQGALEWLQAVGGPERAMHRFARSSMVRAPLDNIDRSLATLYPEARLALEMALHEDEELRALRGELTVLRWAWAREEPVAAIADEI